MFDELEEFMKELEIKHSNIKVLGCYNPDKLNMQIEDYIDEVHLSHTGFKKILN